jgi:uncharacterized protein
MTVAVGTSLLIIVINSVAGFVAHAGSAEIDYTTAGLFSLAAVVGPWPPPVRVRLPADRPRRWFPYLVFAVAAFVAIQAVLNPPELG